MEKHWNILKSIELFEGIHADDLPVLLSCLSAVSTRYANGSIVLSSGELLERFGIVLSGQLRVVQDDYYGNRTILAALGEGSLFGESFACVAGLALPVSVVAAAESEVLFIDCRRLAAPCAKACSFHTALIRNMLSIVCHKNIALMRKIEITSKRSTREKLLAYLSEEARKAGESFFEIPFNRQELADFLCVERSAMSAELSKLRGEGVVRFQKNHFEMLNKTRSETK